MATQVTAERLGDLRKLSSAPVKRAEAARLREAAEVIAKAVREAAARFSKRIPASVKVAGGTNGIFIIAGGDMAPSAYPNEYGKKHPLFKNRKYWYKMPDRPFVEEGIAASADEAADAFSRVVDDWCKALGLE